MLLVKGQVDYQPAVRMSRRSISPTENGDGKIRIADLHQAAVQLESGGEKALGEGDYPVAKVVFDGARTKYSELLGLNNRRKSALWRVEEAGKSKSLTDKSFRGPSRPAAYFKGVESLEKARQALGEEDFAQSKTLAPGVGAWVFGGYSPPCPA